MYSLITVKETEHIKRKTDSRRYIRERLEDIMGKAEMEKAIVDKINEIVRYNDELDKDKKDFYETAVKNGYTGEKPFLFNGYIYTTEIIDVISLVLFGHYAQERMEYDRKYSGIPRGNNYKYILTEEENTKVNKVLAGMMNANVIKFSKSKMMVKLLRR